MSSKSFAQNDPHPAIILVCIQVDISEYDKYQYLLRKHTSMETRGDIVVLYYTFSQPIMNIRKARAFLSRLLITVPVLYVGMSFVQEG